MVKFEAVGLGSVWLNPQHVVGVLPALEKGRPVIGQVVLLVSGYPNMMVKGTASDIVKSLEALRLIPANGGF